MGNPLNAVRARDRFLQLLILNEEYLVNAGHQPALITSLPFVHTARRTNRLDVLLKYVDVCCVDSFLRDRQKRIKTEYLEDGEVVTRFP